MKRLSAIVFSLGLAAAPAFCQAEKNAAESSAKSEGNVKGWEWANFLILAAGLGYLAGKQGGPFFASRSRQIQKDIDLYAHQPEP